MRFDDPGPVRLTPSPLAPPPRPAPPPVRRPLPRRAVLIAGVLVVLIAAAAVAFGRGGDHAATAPPRERNARVAAPTTGRAQFVEAFAIDIGDTTGCQTLNGTQPQMLCPFSDGVVTYMQVDDPQRAYRRIAGPDDAISAHGEAACAQGEADERAWSRANAPAQVAGRYLCRSFEGRAEIWWTVDDAGLLGHASRRDTDLAALFAWWRERNEGES